MQIIVESPGSSGIDSWAIIELQGDLQSNSDDPLGGKVIGDLHFSHQGNPILIIGHHVLTGKAQDLEKPLMVITKKKVFEEGMDVEYDVTAVIKKKLIFKTRPKPIVREAVKK